MATTVTKQNVIDAYQAYINNVLDPNKKMSVSLAYKIAKNEIELRRVFYLISKEIEALRQQFNWDPEKPNGGLTPEQYAIYDSQYQSIINSTVVLDFIMIKISEIDFEVTIEEMKLLSIMIDFE